MGISLIILGILILYVLIPNGNNEADFKREFGRLEQYLPSVSFSEGEELINSFEKKWRRKIHKYVMLEYLFKLAEIQFKKILKK